MNSKFLHFLCVLACAALLGLGPLRAQNPAEGSGGNGSVVTAPAHQSDASHSAISPAATPGAGEATNSNGAADSQKLAAHDRDKLAANQAPSRLNTDVMWLGLAGLLGLLAVIRLRHGSARQASPHPTVVAPRMNSQRPPQSNPNDLRRAA